jgi:4-hydroxythreonine-4-phosphate dehydrogenase
MEELIKVGITMGDPNGIGPEVVIKALADNRILQSCLPVIYGSGKVISFHKKGINANEFNYHTVRAGENFNFKAINLVSVTEEDFKVELGSSTEAAGMLAFKSIEAAVKDLKDQKIDALVTAPINKKNIQSESFNFPGHTEYLAEQFGVKEYLMLMTTDELKVGTVTGHVPVSAISSQITVAKIIEKVKVLNKSLIRDFGIRKPKIAILGLNPHAGDNGLLGKEEQEVIIPAINQLKEQGIIVAGPYGADGFFGSSAIKAFDAVLAMYHDQGLVPFKTLEFDRGVNYTAGLPVVRTSPDHGTGYDLAGKNLASESSLRHALYMAIDIAKKRREYDRLTLDPLRASAMRKEKADR